MEAKKIVSWTMRGLVLLFWLGIGTLFLLASRLAVFMPSRSITVLTWSETFDRQWVKEFEKQTGIKVYLSYYSSNEELLVKMRAGRGSGYDLILPSDYAVERLIAEGLLKKIDASRIVDISCLNKRLLGLSFDPMNLYSLPYVCELFCVAFDKRKVQWDKQKDNPFDLVFKRPDFNSKIVMTNDPLEAFCMAAFYLFGSQKELTQAQKKELLSFLKMQRTWVEAYANIRSDYLLVTGCVGAALMQSAEVWRAMRSYDYLGIAIPKRPFVSIENCAIPIQSKKDELVYSFLRFIYSKASFRRQFETFSIIPARIDVLDELSLSLEQKSIFDLSTFTSLLFVRDIIPENERIDLWVSIKS